MGDEATAAAEAVDHFSRLPDSIIHNILTFLPTRTRDAGRTSVLSKRWNHLWSSYPYLDYFYYPSYTDFLLKQLQEKQYCESDEQNCEEEFLNFLESSVEPRLEKNRFIYRFQMHIDFPDIVMLAPRIDRWVRMAVEKNVVELNLFLLNFPATARIVPIWYSVPQEVLLSETLRHLELWGCKLEGKLDIKLPRLKNLELYEVQGLDVEMLGNLTSGCPSIKNLLLLRCNELKSVSVAGLIYLKSATFFNCHGLRSVEIKAPSLRKFTFGVWLDDENMLCEIKLSTCIALKKLKLCGARMLFQSFISIISKVEVLVLKSCYSLESMELPIQNLKKLVFNNCTNLYIGEIRSPVDREIKDIPVWHPHKFHFQIPLKVHHDIFWWYNFSYFLGEKCMFNNDDLKLAIYNPKLYTIILHDNIKEVSLSSLLEDENLWTSSCICISSMSYSDIVDYLLWERRLTILSVVCPHSKPIQELLSEKLRVESSFRVKNQVHKFCGFKISEEHNMHPTFKIFLEENSIEDYHTTTTFELIWQTFKVGKHEPRETDWDLDISYSNLYFL